MSTELPQLPQLDEPLLRQGIQSLPSLPAVTTDLLRMLDDENASPEGLAKIITQDQALSMRLLRLANSTFFGFSGKVATLHDAIVVIGMRGVRSLALAAALSGAFPKTSSNFDYRVFWEHSIGCALCAQALARHFGINRDEAFMAGLLHDIGRLLLAHCFPDHHAAVMEYLRATDCQPCTAEAAVLGLAHSEIGALLTRIWNFPVQLTEAIAQHHAPGNAPEDRLAQAVHLANAMTHALDLCRSPEGMVPAIDPASWERANLDDDDLDQLFATVTQQFSAARGLIAG